jgi:hypothetical protein
MTVSNAPSSDQKPKKTSDLLARSVAITLNPIDIRSDQQSKKPRRSLFDWLIDASIEFSTRNENAQRSVELAQYHIDRGKDLRRIEARSSSGNQTLLYYDVVDKNYTTLSAKTERCMAALSGWFIKPVLMYPNHRLPKRKAPYAISIAAFNFAFRRAQAKWSFAHSNKLVAEDQADTLFAGRSLSFAPNENNVRLEDGDKYFHKELMRIALAAATKNQSIIKRRYLKGLRNE